MQDCRVLVIGGYGFFGRRLVERLAQHPGLHVLVAGRSIGAARQVVQELQQRAHARLEGVALDAQAASLADDLRRLRPAVVINASGPFQGQDYRVPAACIAAGVHAIDLADSRAYVTNIGSLDQEARAAGVLVTSGASSVPALSAAAVDALAHGLAELRSIDIGISPGNRTERGLATVRAILGDCGKPLPASGGKPAAAWVGTRRHVYPAPVGARLLSPCDVPDLVLFPQRYPGRPSTTFTAGLELEFLHRGMNAMAWASRIGLVRDWSRHAVALKWLADRFRTWGSDAGAMHVALTGIDGSGRECRRSWHLLATHGDGPYVPTLAAAALVRKLAAGVRPAPGAGPCLGLLSLADFQQAATGLHITMESTTP